MSVLVSVAAKLPTAFTDALRGAVARVPGARAAVFLDGEGEAVDEFSESSRTAIQLVGAHLGVVLMMAREKSDSWGVPIEMIIETERSIVVAVPLNARYLAVLEAAPGTCLGKMRAELTRAVNAIQAQL